MCFVGFFGYFWRMLVYVFVTYRLVRDAVKISESCDDQ